MIVNSIGTILYSYFYGKKIGEDQTGNKFFTHKKIENKRWVLYKNMVDPTILDVKWQIWLTNKNSKENPIKNEGSFTWQKKKKANLTGTESSYHPIDNNKPASANTQGENKKVIWEPDQ